MIADSRYCSLMALNRREWASPEGDSLWLGTLSEIGLYITDRWPNLATRGCLELVLLNEDVSAGWSLIVSFPTSITQFDLPRDEVINAEEALSIAQTFTRRLDFRALCSAQSEQY